MVNSIVLSAGKGTRMKSKLPKVVQKVAGIEMVNMVLKSLDEAGVDNNILIVGYEKEEVMSRVDTRFNCDYVEQVEQLGTGHAVMVAKEALAKLSGVTIITCGDTPLVTGDTFKSLIDFHKENKNDLTILTAKIDDPTNYGRIIRDEKDFVQAIVEHKDADEKTLLINEINSGIYCFNNELLIKHLSDINNENAQGEYYLTDLVEIFKNNNYQVSGFIANDIEETLGVNDIVALSQASNILKRRINREHMINGVNIIDPDNTYIDPNVVIESGVTIYPGNQISGATVIKSRTILHNGNVISDTEIGENCTVGPNSHLRNNVVIGNDCRIGNYVEVKNSAIGNGTKAAHLTYIGDAKVGDNVNFGCGVVIANYDGVNKHLTEIEDECFIGSNSVLIAPIHIGYKTFIAADTTVSKSVGVDSFVTSRVPQRTKNRRK